MLTLLILVTNGPLGITSLWGQALAPAVPGGKSAAPVISRRGASAGTTSQLKVVAVVNQEQITRQELAREVLRRYGSEVLESMVNKKLILQACQQRQIVVTNKDVEEEIARIASRFGLSVERWLSMLQKDRDVSPDKYRRDIIWPTLALRRLAADKIEVSDEELEKAFEREYGPRVKIRMMMVSNRERADQLRAQAVAKPSSFGDLAKE
ncbi:MAG: peptidylprolyl isomerase, partial [Planctomycetaceae bacterium]|nr:peptidylprolyl isomerase [Planctomycetaceae bacterium]